MLLNRIKIGCDPALELRARYFFFQFDFAMEKTEHRTLSVRERHLDPLNGLMQLVSKIVLHKVKQGVQLLWFEGLSGNALEHRESFGRAQEREMMPALQLEIDPRGNREQFAAGIQETART